MEKEKEQGRGAERKSSVRKVEIYWNLLYTDTHRETRYSFSLLSAVELAVIGNGARYWKMLLKKILQMSVKY